MPGDPPLAPPFHLPERFRAPCMFSRRFRRAAHRPARPTTSTAAAVVQPLEARRMLAGTVRAIYGGTDGNTLFIQGDNADNNVLVDVREVTSRGQLLTRVEVRGFGGTTIVGGPGFTPNGSSQVAFLAGDLSGVNAQMLGGDDYFDLEFGNGIDRAGQIALAGGGGDDFLDVSAFELTADILLAGQAGNDDLSIFLEDGGPIDTPGTLIGVLSMQGGTGNDSFDVTGGAISSGINIAGEDGNDTVLVEGLDESDPDLALASGGPLRTFTGSGTDVVYLNNVSAADTIITDTGKGVDALAMLNVSADRKISTTTGEGSSAVAYVDVESGGFFTHLGGDAVDSVAVLALDARRDVRVATFGGDDLLAVSGSFTQRTADAAFFDTGEGNDTLAVGGDEVSDYIDVDAIVAAIEDEYGSDASFITDAVLDAIGQNTFNRVLLQAGGGDDVTVYAGNVVATALGLDGGEGRDFVLLDDQTTGQLLTGGANVNLPFDIRADLFGAVARLVATENGTSDINELPDRLIAERSDLVDRLVSDYVNAFSFFFA